MAEALYDKLEDGSYAGHIPACQGVVAFGSSLRECEGELQSTLEDWILLGLRMAHPLPVFGGIDLNEEPQREPVERRVNARNSFASCAARRHES
jgi:predicted RNase H-like HicB family nuclease